MSHLKKTTLIYGCECGLPIICHVPCYNSRLWKLFPLQNANVAYFQIKVQLFGFYAYPGSSSSQLVRISAVLLY